jgi:hypothetical protein
VDELRLYFRNDRATNRYRQPASYNVQYWNGSAFVDAGSQVRSPSAPRANYNRVRFASVSTQRIRVQVTHASGFRTGLTEVQAYGRGGTDPGPDPRPGSVDKAGPATAAAGSVGLLEVTAYGP